MNQLFRGDTFGVHFINNSLFSDLGIKYIRYLIIPLIEGLEKEKKNLDIVKEPKTEEEIISRNKLLELCDKFLGNLVDSFVRCPM